MDAQKQAELFEIRDSIIAALEEDHEVYGPVGNVIDSGITMDTSAAQFIIRINNVNYQVQVREIGA